MNIAITGANGFIGSFLVKYLSSLSYDLTLIQRKSPSESFFVQGINGKTDFSKILQGVDVVIHCASLVHQKSDKSISFESYRSVNIDGTKRLAEDCVKCGVKRLIFLSSIKVNGEFNDNESMFDNYSEPNPNDSYAISKYLAEKELRLIESKSSLQVVIVRPPLVYGPLVKANFFKLIKVIDSGYPLPLLNVNNSRSFMYVENLVMFLEKCISNEMVAGRTLLISDPKPLSTKELIYNISELLGKNTRLFYFPISILSFFALFVDLKSQLNKLVCSLVVDPRETYSLVNWYPPIDFSLGIEKTVNWFLLRK